MTVVIDAAALMALMLDERGADIVANVVRGSLISVVNVSESCSRGVERGARVEDILGIIRGYEVEIVAFGLEQALETASLREPTRHAGSSLGDRACLALARLRTASLYTADTRMGSLAGHLGIDIRLIR